MDDEEDVIAQIVNGVAGPAILGDDPLNHERVWDKLYWTLMPRGQTGYAAHALAAIDIALWDIKGKALGQPVWRLLGGARDRAPVYATFGFGFICIFCDFITIVRFASFLAHNMWLITNPRNATTTQKAV